MSSTTAIRKAALGLASLAGLAALSACAINPGEDAICTDPGPNNPGWPYCGPADPGGHQPGDDPIDPTGRGGAY
ncbi:MAG: hypothetical protein ACLFQ5_03405 [Oceanicaulis sp.]